MIIPAFINEVESLGFVVLNKKSIADKKPNHTTVLSFAVKDSGIMAGNLNFFAKFVKIGFYIYTEDPNAVPDYKTLEFLRDYCDPKWIEDYLDLFKQYKEKSNNRGFLTVDNLEDFSFDAR